jgi:hypothetical protein
LRIFGAKIIRERAEMGKHTTTDREHVEEKDRGYRVVAAEKKATAKKAAKKKKTGKKAASKKRKAAKPAPAVAAPAASAAPEPSAAPAARPEPVFSAPSDEARAGGPMRGIVALWGPLAIIVLLIVVSRLGDEEPGELADRAVAGLSSSLDRAGSAARDVVEDVQDALTGGDPQAAAALGAGADGRRSSGSDLAAAFQDAGVASDAGGLAPGAAPKPAPGADPWRDSTQTTTPASVSDVAGGVPPQPENPWAPVDPRAVAAPPADPYAGTGAVPPPAGPGPGYGYGYGYGGGYAGEPAAPGAYPPPGQAYPPLPPGYGAAPPPGYGGRAPGYPQQQAWGAPPPGYGVPPAYPYPPQPYGVPQPYPPGYYPPAQ